MHAAPWIRIAETLYHVNRLAEEIPEFRALYLILAAWRDAPVTGAQPSLTFAQFVELLDSVADNAC